MDSETVSVFLPNREDCYERSSPVENHLLDTALLFVVLSAMTGGDTVGNTQN